MEDRVDADRKRAKEDPRGAGQTATTIRFKWSRIIPRTEPANGRHGAMMGGASGSAGRRLSGRAMVPKRLRTDGRAAPP